MKLTFAAGLMSVAMLAAAQSPPRSGTTNAAMDDLILTDVYGVGHRPLAATGQKATVLFFVLSDCPIANAYAPEINRIVAAYGDRGVRSYVVYVEDDLSGAAARQHAKEHEFKAPVLLDPSQQLVKLTQATISPEVAVLAPDHTALYRGRIDDRAAALGKTRVTPSKRDLREALDALLAGRPVPTPITKAVGCYLPVIKATKPHEK